VVDAYTLTLAGLLLLGGTLGDSYGRRKLFVIGTVWFAVASLLVAVALPTLVVRWAIEWREESVARGGRVRDDSAAQIASAEAA